MATNILIRQVKDEDIPDLVRLRRLMFEWMDVTDKYSLDKNDQENQKYFEKAIPLKSFLGWVAVTDQKRAVACGGLVIDQHPPGPTNLSGKIGYIMNISVEPDYRNQGLAKKILKEMLIYLKRIDISVVSLHASEMGKHLYEKIGFKNTNEMRLKLTEIDFLNI